LYIGFGDGFDANNWSDGWEDNDEWTSEEVSGLIIFI